MSALTESIATLALEEPEVVAPKGVVLVTGGAGFIGSHVAEYLLNRGESVAVVDEVSCPLSPPPSRSRIASFSDPRRRKTHLRSTTITT